MLKCRWSDFQLHLRRPRSNSESWAFTCFVFLMSHLQYQRQPIIRAASPSHFLQKLTSLEPCRKDFCIQHCARLSSQPLEPDNNILSECRKCRPALTFIRWAFAHCHFSCEHEQGVDLDRRATCSQQSGAWICTLTAAQTIIPICQWFGQTLSSCEFLLRSSALPAPLLRNCVALRVTVVRLVTNWNQMSTPSSLSHLEITGSALVPSGNAWYCRTSFSV